MSGVQIIGQMDNVKDHTYESANRIYSRGGQCPTIPTGAGGGHLPKTIRKVSVLGGVSDAQWGKQFRQQYRVIDPKGLSYAISATAIPIMTPRKV